MAHTNMDVPFLCMQKALYILFNIFGRCVLIELPQSNQSGSVLFA